MSTLRDRRAHAAAQAAIARAAARAEGYDNAAPRRAINGHTPDCPRRQEGWMRRCGWCLAEAAERRVELERQARQAAAAPPAPRQAEERQCPTCFGPTTDPERHCA